MTSKEQYKNRMKEFLQKQLQTLEILEVSPEIRCGIVSKNIRAELAEV